jgi:DNA-binding FadR family transcriptional regulator
LQSGSRFASEQALRVRYKVGTGVLREAIRVLELQECGRMRPGRGGGFIVGHPTRHLVGQALAGYLCLRGATLQDLVRAHGAVAAVAIELAQVDPDHTGDEVRAGQDSERLLTRIARRGGNVIACMMAEVLEALFDHLPQQIIQKQAGSVGSSCDALCERKFLTARNRGRKDQALRYLAHHEGHLGGTSSAKLEPLAHWYRMTERIQVFEKRAGQVARNMLIEIVHGGIAPGTRLGTAAELRKRLAVSKSVSSQALRLLETIDVVRCRRGRGCGIYVNKPTSERPIMIISNYLCSHNIGVEQTRQIIDGLRRTSSFEAHPSNPVLALILECLESYRLTLRSSLQRTPTALRSNRRR